MVLALHRLVCGTLVAGLVVCAATSSKSAPSPRHDRADVTRLAARWVRAVSARDPAAFDLLSRSGQDELRRKKRLALRAGSREVLNRSAVEQLEAMLLRGMLEPGALAAMGDRELFVFALEQGLVGASLRSLDVLRDVVVGSDEARGRLYKFGHDTRPDRGLQYFVRENGRWRVTLRGERERAQRDFDAFLARSGLSDAEAAFFILEMRLMRKVTSADFVAPNGLAPATNRVGSGLDESVLSSLRVVAVRHARDSAGSPAAVFEDRAESLRYVLEPGDTLPPAPHIRLLEVEGDAAVIETNEGTATLRLAPGGPPLNQRLDRSGRSTRSLLDIARQGEARAGLMAQWRNVGLRDRPLLLQQGQLTPVHADRRMLGLRARALAEGSFWDQLGVAPGDLLTAVNGRKIDSMEAWQELIEIAQNELSITITLERNGEPLRFETRTIRPRRARGEGRQ